MPAGKVTVPSTLSGHAAEIYRSAFLGAYDGTCAKPEGRRGGASVGRDACAAKVAWGAVKEKYKKGKGGKWVARAEDAVVGPISDVPSQTGLPVFGTGMDYQKGQKGTKLQQWRMAYVKALQGECRNAYDPVGCAREKANTAVGFVETDVKPIERQGRGRKEGPLAAGPGGKCYCPECDFEEDHVSGDPCEDKKCPRCGSSLVRRSLIKKGGAGSGHHGHVGRPGEVGGSLPSGAAARPAGARGVREGGSDYQTALMDKVIALQNRLETEDLSDAEFEKLQNELLAANEELLDTGDLEYQREDPLGEEARKKHEAEEPFFERYEATSFEKKLDGMRRHKFLTKEIEKKLPALYSQENNPDPTVQAKWFHPYSSMTWYATEYDPKTGMFFGYVDSGDPFTSELGYFSRQEMAETLVRGLPIERDKYFDPVRLSEVKAQHETRAFYRTKGATYPLIKIRGGAVERSNGRSGTMDQYNDYPLAYVLRRQFDTAKREKMAEAGTAMKDGSFPIGNCEDVTNALRSLGRTSKPRGEVIPHIRTRAKSLGCEMTPALKEKAAAIERYLDRLELRAQANEVDMAHIRTLGDNPIDRPNYIPSEIWKTLPPNHRTVRAEATRRIIERKYAQAVEDAEMSGWRVARNHYNPEEFYFSKRFPIQGEINDVVVRAILVRRVESLDWCLRAMSGFASGTIAQLLPEGIIRHTIKYRTSLPFVEAGGPGSGHHGHVGRPGEVGGSAPSGAAAGPAGARGVREGEPPYAWTLEPWEVEEFGADVLAEHFGEEALPPEYREGGKKTKPLAEQLPEMSLSQIAREVSKDWEKVNFAAVPYLEALGTLQEIGDNFMFDTGESVVAYFLSNARTWKGETARAVKKELNKRLKAIR